MILNKEGEKMNKKFRCEVCSNFIDLDDADVHSACIKEYLVAMEDVENE